MQPVSNFRHSVYSKGPLQNSAVPQEGSRCVTVPEHSLVRWNNCNRKEEKQCAGEGKTAAAAAGVARAVRGQEENTSRKWSVSGVDEKNNNPVSSNKWYI